MNGEALTILLVEDNDDHAEVVGRSLERHRVANAIHRVSDGEAALDYLLHRGPYLDPATSPRPNLILLDLRLPKVDGMEVLRQIKQSPALHRIPVVMLTTSAAEQDVGRAYDLHANSYLVKPVNFEGFDRMMHDLGYYWLAWNRDPWDGR
jgi:CheY-like chemotaxis protein